MRVIRALHELGVEAVAVYSTADSDALHVRLADQAVCIGPPAADGELSPDPERDRSGRDDALRRRASGLRLPRRELELRPACADNDLVFVGPSPEVMDALGDKAQAKIEMRAAGVPLVPGSEAAASLDELRRDRGARSAIPVLLKATAGGGGKGMRLVASDEELEASYRAAATEAEAAFGDGSLYLEKAVSPARHVEIQVLCDAAGGVLTLGRARVLDPAPPPEAHRGVAVAGADPETREEMEEAVTRACRAVGYVNAGTFEFLLGPAGEPYFIEVNCRLQVEHPVTELVTGIDIVREQLRIAAGEPLSLTGRAPRRGHAIEIRLERRGPGARLPAGAGAHRAVPDAAGAWGAGRHRHRRR